MKRHAARFIRGKPGVLTGDLSGVLPVRAVEKITFTSKDSEI